ncbi:MAG TPA: hypothetical protein VHK06_02485, partial [Candidatus Limnocylindria bacterium]|nr:hypothetical protein [Candidatus Limnocylindria bacterium]
MIRPAASASDGPAAVGPAGGRAVRVAVDALADRPERTFSYLLPPHLDDAGPGSLLLVPYGRRLALGYLLPGDAGDVPDDVYYAVSAHQLRPVEAVVSAPMLTGELLALAEEIAAYYRAPVGTTVAAMLPPGVESRVRRRWRVLAPDDLPGAVLAGRDDGLVDEALLLRHGPRRGREAWLERLRRRGALRAEWTLEPPSVA